MDERRIDPQRDLLNRHSKDIARIDRELLEKSKAGHRQTMEIASIRADIAEMRADVADIRAQLSIQTASNGQRYILRKGADNG